MKTITFINCKGGVGKSSTVQAVSYLLTLRKKRVLVVDIDPQANTTLALSDIDLMDLLKKRTGMAGDLQNPVTVEDLLVDRDMDPRDAIRSTAYEGLDIIRALPTLAAVEESLKADVRTPQQFRLRNQLAKVANDYDYVLIDCGPSLSILNINALVASEEVFIPTQVDSGSLWGVSMTIEELIRPVRSYAPKLMLGGIFITRCKDRTISAQEGFRVLAELWPDKFLPFTINENAAVTNASQKKVPLPVYDRNSRAQATKDYKLLAGYIDAADRVAYLRDLMDAGKES